LKTVLHVGCGGDPLPEWLNKYSEIRVDINPACNPDIVANMTDLGDIGTYDAILCQHALEHLYPYDVETALKEFYRVLNDGGILVLFVPDCEDVKPTNDVLFNSPAGDIAGIDLLYGFRPMLKEHPYMAHHMAFTQETLHDAMTAVGFKKVVVNRLEHYAMMGAAVK
jgi:predicted SAM-dependent methyltransferase